MVKTIFILLILIGTLGPNYGFVPEKEGNFITIIGILLGLFLFVGKPIYSLFSKKRNNETQKNEEKKSEDTNNMKNKYTDEFKKIVAKEANEGSKTLKELGEKYNINPTLVRNWKIQFQDQSSVTLPTEEEKKNIEKSPVSEINPLSITNIQTNLSLDDDLDTIKNALNVSKSFIEQAKNNIKKGILTDKFANLESAENYLTDGFSLIQAKSWLDVELALKESLTDAMEMIEDDAYEEGYDDSVDSITYLKETNDNHTTFIKSLVVNHFLHNAGYEFKNLDWDESDKLEVPSEEKKNIEKSPVSEIIPLSITNIQTNLSSEDDSETYKAYRSVELATIKNALNDSKLFIEKAKDNIKQGILTDQHDRLESAENYITDGLSLIQAKSWLDVELALKASLTDPLVMIEENALEEGYDDPVDPVAYLIDKHDNHTVFIKYFVIDYFLYNAGYEFENLEWDESDKQEVTSNEIETKSAEDSNTLDSQSINNIVQFLGDLDNNSQLKENIEKAQQYVNEAKFKVSEGSLGDEFNSLESAQNYLNDAYSLIKAKNWDEIILSLQNSQTDAMTMLSEEADSEDSDDILSYLQDLHETYEACVFDIIVYNFLYNAGAEFESLQW